MIKLPTKADKSNRVASEENNQFSFFIAKEDNGNIVRAFCTLREDDKETVIEVKIIKVNPNYYDDS